MSLFSPYFGCRTSELFRAIAWYFRSGWLRSWWACRSVDGWGNPIPWLTYSAIRWLDDHVKPDWDVFEYGAGYSTIWFKSRCNVRSVDHDGDWTLLLAKMGIVINNTTEKHRYVPMATGKETLVIIDGAWREDCAIHIAGLTVKPVYVMIDNTQRADCELYRGGKEALAILKEHYKHCITFTGMAPGGSYEETTLLMEPVMHV